MNKLFFLSLVLCASFVNADTFNVTNSHCGPGSYPEAVKLANQNPGLDTINITAGLEIDLSCVNAFGERYPITATEPLIIEGNGATINGNQLYVSKISGHINVLNRFDDDCPSDLNSDKYVLGALAPPLIEVGRDLTDSAGVDVTIKNLNVRSLSGIAAVRPNASLTIENSTFTDIRDLQVSCNRFPITADNGADVTLDGVTIKRSKVWEKPGLSALIFGTGTTTPWSSKLIIRNSVFDTNYAGNFILWYGDVDIVSSQITNSGGVRVYDSDANIYNTLLSNAFSTSEDWFYANNSNVTLKASTLSFAEVDCPPATCIVAPLSPHHEPVQSTNNSGITLVQSAIQVLYTGSTLYPTALLAGYSGGTFSADQYSFIQPTDLSSASALKTLTNQPALITDAPALFNTTIASEYFTAGGPSIVTPLLGTTTSPGLLVDNIPDAGPGGANELFAPDGTTIQYDAFQHSRVDLNNRRSTGAIQVNLAPIMFAQAQDSSIRVLYTKPNLPDLARYEVCYGEGTPPLLDTTVCPGILESVDSSAQTETIIDNLENGKIYWLSVRGVGTAFGPWSTVQQATPLTGILAPVLSGNAEPNAIVLSWTKPDNHGFGISGYQIYYREAGATDWIKWQDLIPEAQLSLTITNLTNNTLYEVGIIAVGNDGSLSSMAFTSATPHAEEVLGKALIGTEKAGSTTLATLIVLCLLLISRNVKFRSFPFFMLGLLPLTTHANSESNDGVAIELIGGASYLAPDLGDTSWQQDSHVNPSFGLGVGYQFNANWSLYFNYHWLNHAELKSADINYPDTEVHYHMYNLNTRYRINQLWGDLYAPFVILGVGKLDTSISGEQSLIDSDRDIQLSTGLGINLVDNRFGKIDLSWEYFSGDAHLFGLRLSIPVHRS
ncbi:fibronectin type III domain-containing protein [Vibrio breoganii]|uniref:fibronectin type III domain-containing protein n=1 Tax=Vibrio breoganii TaxID=553239 RepID=UPI000301A1D6|nr:fibronectin type III domain-containing protein [Vibrio breoganii]OED83086.1 hypothetical protein A1QE_15235 [Vibrio breoganii ZF-55]